MPRSQSNETMWNESGADRWESGYFARIRGASVAFLATYDVQTRVLAVTGPLGQPGMTNNVIFRVAVAELSWLHERDVHGLRCNVKLCKELS